jgi:hypothetical protein
VTESFQLLELIVDRIADATLQQAGDILIELAVLAPQRGNGDDRGRMDVPQVKDDLIQGHGSGWRAPPNRPAIPLLRPAAHHAGNHMTY